MGGVAIDNSCRALNYRSEPIPGLFATGEVAGFGWINGKAGLEGTFLGPAIAQGRVAARAILAAAGRAPGAAVTGRESLKFREADHGPAQATSCLKCHELPAQVKEGRAGFWHFEKVHAAVLAQQLSCRNCHAEIPDTGGSLPHRTIDAQQLLLACGICHQGESR
jgi:hypothetical protein